MSENLSDFTGQVNEESVNINGIVFTLSEFNMRVRALWLDVVGKFGLEESQRKLQTEIIPKISAISNDIENDPRITSVQKRLLKLGEKHDELMELYATDDEPEDMDEQLEAVVVKMEELQDKLDEVAIRVQEEVFAEAKVAEEEVSNFMQNQDRARIYFVWQLAQSMGETELDFDEFYGECDGADYEAAEKLVNAGNARWASLYSNRMQMKPQTKTLN